MRLRTTPIAATLLAVGALLGWLTDVTEAQENKSEPVHTSDQLAERTLYRRAVETVIWSMPAVNYELMYQAMVKNKGAYNQVVYWSGLPGWKNQTLTPNPDTIYFMPFIDTTDVGPVVLEIPPAEDGSITGTVMDAWQCALDDVGPAGVDKGKGGKYLILPPGYTEKTPDGYILAHCRKPGEHVRGCWVVDLLLGKS